MSQTMSRPIVGITLDSEQPGGYSKFPWYAVRENYCSAVTKAGGLPLPLPHEPDIAESYLDTIDALIITGGAFDVDPSLFGDKTRHETVITKDRRTSFEIAVTRGAIDRDMPVLGICGGQQLLNVVLGGTLIQHIPDEIKDSLAHEQPNPRDEPGHDIKVTPGTLLHKITGTETMSVNSAHHQAVRTIGKNIVINAMASDGVIEGIELPAKRFCLGVQWHPEFSIDPGDLKIFDAFIKAAR
jgi:putative glutamine amidotransferase